MLFRSATINAHSTVFSHTNRLYVTEFGGGGKIYDMSADPNNVTIKSFPLPSWIDFDLPTPILPTPDESWILIHTFVGIQMWSLRQSTNTRDAPPDDIMGVDFSRDASLLALATETGIEIWDARIGQRRKVIQRESRSVVRYRPVAFSPKGELIVSNSKDGIIFVDVRAGELLPMTYSSPPIMEPDYSISVGISFDLSKIAALYRSINEVPQRYLYVWDLPGGTLLHSLQYCGVNEIQWSSRDQYLLLKQIEEHTSELQSPC